MTVNCKEEIFNCISRYQKELASTKQGIIDIFNNLNNDNYKFDVNKFSYKGDKVCFEYLFDKNSKCEDTRFGGTKPRTYDEWQRDIEKKHAQELTQWIKDEIDEIDGTNIMWIEDIIGDKIQESVNKKIGDDQYYGEVKVATEDFIKNTENILKHIKVVDDSDQYNIDNFAFTFI